jgi:hypothetical protein
VKAVSWQSDARTLERQGIPKRFTTTSRVAIIANRWQSVDADVAALEDRGHFLLFDPTPLAVHRRAAGWFWDQEVFDFVGTQLHLAGQHSLRTYVLAAELKAAGLDWRRGVLGRCLSGTRLAVAQLRADPGYATEKDRVRAFIGSGAGCRATYFNHAKTLSTPGLIPDIRLAHTSPPEKGGPVWEPETSLDMKAGDAESVGLLDQPPETGDKHGTEIDLVTTSICS